MNIRIAGITNDSVVDGLGIRLTVFTQGCPHHCPGCHNPQSHDFDGGEVYDTDAILEIAQDNFLLDGVTLSGGEPFAQAESCAEIAKGVHALGLNVWCYTGYTYEMLINGDSSWRNLLNHVDILVDGPFILAQRTLDSRFRGSSNQRIIDVPASLKTGNVILSELN